MIKYERTDTAGKVQDASRHLELFDGRRIPTIHPLNIYTILKNQEKIMAAYF